MKSIDKPSINVFQCKQTLYTGHIYSNNNNITGLGAGKRNIWHCNL